MTNENETIRGTILRVHFCNADRPWMAGVLEAGGRSIRFAGACAANEGDRIEVVGRWGEHPKFGRQFEVESGLVKMDESPDALAHLIAKDKRFGGLGETRAKQVVDAALAVSDDGDFGSALVTYPKEIAARAGVKVELVANAAAEWAKRRDFFEALAALVDQGWTSGQATRIVGELGNGAAAIVKSDPYALIGRISRFGFRTVDVVAHKMGVELTDPRRLAAGVAYCLDRIGDEGDTWTTRDGLFDVANKELRPNTLDGEDRIRATIEDLITRGLVYVDRAPNGEEIVADARLAYAEFDVFERLLAGLSEVSRDLEEGRLSFKGPKAEAILSTLNKGQAIAVWGIWTHRFSVVSGGAGVGKTYTMRAVCDLAVANGLDVALCAPTGKAARKLERAAQRRAMTIHKLLEPGFDEKTGDFYFKRGPKNLLDEDLVVVDELSMVDVKLMRSLLSALRPDARLLMVGDHHQIPSVGPGAILRDLLAARASYPGAVHVLDQIVRQAGTLARNTSAILDGVLVQQQDAAWGMVPTEKGHEDGAAAAAADIVEALVTMPEPPDPFGRFLDFEWDVQVLSPMRKGPLGTYILNVHLQQLRQRLLGNLPPEPVEPNKPPKPLVGDRVIWTKNDYELDLLNGTQAIVQEIRKGGAMVLRTEDGREVTIDGAKRVNVEVAYAMTIHKAQGSEWPAVLLVGSTSHWRMHDRNLLYTGASRASESLTILGDRGGLQHFAKERRSAVRKTFGSFLVDGWSPMRHLQPVAVARDENASVTRAIDPTS